MKKQIPFLVLGNLLLVLLASCEKEADDQAKGYFKLTTEKHQSPNKTSVESTTVEWVESDTVRLYVGESHENNYEVYTVDDEAFVYLEEGNENDPVRAYYPKTIIASGGNTNSPTVVFPNSYNSRYSGGRQVLALPMVAKGVVRDKKIVFKHLSAAINVVVNNGTDLVLTFDSVVVSSKNYLLSGTMNLYLGEDDYGITAITPSDSNAVTVHLTDAPTIAPDGTLTVQVPIRPIGEAVLRIEVFAHCLANKNNISGTPRVYMTTRYHYSNAQPVSGLGRNKMMTARIKITNAGSTSKDTIDNHSLFTIDAQGHQVRFSKGNLKQNGSSWSFHENQYDCSATQDDTERDLFQWSVAGDWNSAGTSVADTTGWRVLTAAEWEYIVNIRLGNRFAKARVAGVNGLILFPDNYVQPSEIRLNYVNVVSSDLASIYSDFNDLDATDWGKMEAAGAIFLPAVHSGGGEGHYWSTSTAPAGESKALSLCFSVSTLSPANPDDKTNTPCSIRLVMEKSN